MKLQQNISTIAVSPRGKRYVVSIACVLGTNEIALIDEDTDEFVRFTGSDDVARFYSFAEMSGLMTLIREKIIDLDVGFLADLNRSVGLHPAGRINHLHIQ